MGHFYLFENDHVGPRAVVAGCQTCQLTFLGSSRARALLVVEPLGRVRRARVPAALLLASQPHVQHFNYFLA